MNFVVSRKSAFQTELFTVDLYTYLIVCIDRMVFLYFIQKTFKKLDRTVNYYVNNYKTHGTIHSMFTELTHIFISDFTEKIHYTREQTLQ